MDITKTIKEINEILADAAAEKKQEEQLKQLHIAVGKTCCNLLEDAIIRETMKPPIGTGQKWLIKIEPTPTQEIEIARKALEINIINTNESCINAAIYLWEALRGKNDPLSERERQRATKAIRTYLSRNDIINMETVFCAISSVII